MIIYSILLLIYELLVFLLGLIPTFDGVFSAFSFLPTLLERIITFNYYLPIVEALGVVVGCIFITLNYKAIKVVLGFFNIDLNK